MAVPNRVVPAVIGRGLPGSLGVARVACEQVDIVYVTLEVTLLRGSRTRGGDSVACSSGEGGGDQGD